LISDNIARHNSRGFLLAGSSDNYLSSNLAEACERGFFLLQSHRNELIRNAFTTDTNGFPLEFGFLLEDSYDNTIDGIDGSHKLLGTSVGTGIATVNCDNIVISNYIIKGFDVGISIENGNNHEIKVNYISENNLGIYLKSAIGTIIYNNIITENSLGVFTDVLSIDNYIYLNLFINNADQIQDLGENSWWNSSDFLGNFWSNYWGEDDGSNGRIAGDYIGDTDLPHEGVDMYPLLDPSIPMRYEELPIGDDWWYTSFLVWRGGWSPVDIQVTNSLGRDINRDMNEIGLNAWYTEDDQWNPGSTNVMIILATPPLIPFPPLNPYPEQSYSFQMTAFEDLIYSMEWFVSLAGDILFERTVEDAFLTADQTKTIEMNLKETPEGLIISTVPKYTFSGIKQPINPDGTSVFKLGRTVPVKFQLFDNLGLVLDAAHVTIDLAKINDGVIGTFEETISKSAADTGNIFRYDSEEEQYIYNLSTDELETGTYVIVITLDDGQIFKISISFR